MSNKSDKTNVQGKIDWRKKGLGWVPDYPDRRDYILQSEEVQTEGRLKRDEVTGSIENITQSIIKAFKILDPDANKKDGENPGTSNLPGNPTSETNTESTNLTQEGVKDLSKVIQNLEARIFGEIEFKDVKLYRILRKGSKNGEVLKLKTYLYISSYFNILDFGLFFDAYPSPQNQDDKEKIHKKWFDGWINDKEFKEDTEALVLAFQNCIKNLDKNIKSDGIVNLHTYLWLSNWISKGISHNPEIYVSPDKLASLSNPSKTVPLKSPVPISSIASPYIYNSIFNELKKRTISQLKVEWQDPNTLRNKINSSDYIFKDLFDKDLLDKIQDIHTKSSKEPKSEETLLGEFEKVLNTILKNNLFVDNKDGEVLKEIFQQAFLVLDPIVSLIVTAIYPLSKYKNFEEAVKKGFQVLDALLILPESFTLSDRDSLMKLVQNSLSSIEIIEKILAASDLVALEDLANSEFDNLRKLASRAIKKANQLLDKELNSFKELNLLIDEREKYKQILCFYFIVRIFIDSYNIAVSIDETDLTAFNKTELFEIDLPLDSETESRSFESRNINNELLIAFSPVRLTIPISKHLYSTRAWLDTSESGTKPYFFLPGAVDLSFWCSSIEDQGSLNSCAAFAGVALVEYFEKRSFGRYIDASPLFLYKVARNVMNVTGDVGASLRDTMKTMAAFGVPPEQYWPYLEENVDEEPTSFCYSFAQNYQALKYFRLDYAGISEEVLLFQIKAVLAAGFPCMFGFTIYSSAYEEVNAKKGWMPLPSKQDRVVGGHAMVAVGYSDYEIIPGPDDKKPISQGALLVRNSWGTAWGRSGYGWLPYDYVLEGLTADWWSLLKAEWFENDAFGLGTRNVGAVAVTGQTIHV